MLVARAAGITAARDHDFTFKLNSTLRPTLAKNTMRMSSTANGDGTAVETKFIKKLSEIQHLSCGQRNKFTGSLYASGPLQQSARSMYPRSHCC
jgi:hypothetical protein